MESIHFFSEQIDFNLRAKSKIRSWIRGVVREHKKSISSLNYIFTTDNQLLKINQQFLDHNTYTDIITFDQSTNGSKLESDIYISIDRVAANAENMSLAFEDELHRVMIHGVLHLLGFNDKTNSEQKEMRKKENHYLALRFNLKK